MWDSPKPFQNMNKLFFPCVLNLLHIFSTGTPVQGNEGNGYGPQGVVRDPIQVPLFNPLVQQGLAQPAAENLRRLASRYVHHPDSQVGMVRVEAGPAGRYKVVIVLEIADIL